LLQRHYSAFVARTGCSVPVPRIGTQTLAGSPLESLPSHRGDRFPGSTHEPETDSRHLHAGRHADSMRISSALIPEERLAPVLTSSLRFRRVVSGSLAFVFPFHTWHDLVVPFTMTLTTRALDPSRSRWFAACLRRPAARDLPSSHVYIAWRTI